jgi:hypothetical protein
MNKSNKIQHTKKALIDSLEKSLGVVTTACKQVLVLLQLPASKSVLIGLRFIDIIKRIKNLQDRLMI